MLHTLPQFNGKGLDNNINDDYPPTPLSVCTRNATGVSKLHLITSISKHEHKNRYLKSNTTL